MLFEFTRVALLSKLFECKQKIQLDNSTIIYYYFLIEEKKVKLFRYDASISVWKKGKKSVNDSIINDSELYPSGNYTIKSTEKRPVWQSFFIRNLP